MVGLIDCTGIVVERPKDQDRKKVLCNWHKRKPVLKFDADANLDGLALRDGGARLGLRLV